MQVFDKHVPVKNKTVRANHAPYMTKALRSAIMRRSNLERKFVKTRDPEIARLHKKQKIIVVGFTRRKGENTMVI